MTPWVRFLLQSAGLAAGFVIGLWLLFLLINLLSSTSSSYY